LFETRLNILSQEIDSDFPIGYMAKLPVVNRALRILERNTAWTWFLKIVGEFIYYREIL
jgi:hypothetical protein